MERAITLKMLDAVGCAFSKKIAGPRAIKKLVSFLEGDRSKAKLLNSEQLGALQAEVPGKFDNITAGPPPAAKGKGPAPKSTSTKAPGAKAPSSRKGETIDFIKEQLNAGPISRAKLIKMVVTKFNIKDYSVANYIALAKKSKDLLGKQVTEKEKVLSFA